MRPAKPKKDPIVQPPNPKNALVEIGKPAPDFSLPDQQDKVHHLHDYRGQWVILYFYPKDDTPGCTKEACQFRDGLPRLKKIKAVVLGVSPDGVTSHAKFAAKYELAFPLLADDEMKVCRLYGVWQEKSMYGKKYMGVVRTTYLINPQGVVTHRFDKVVVPHHDEQVLAAINASK